MDLTKQMKMNFDEEEVTEEERRVVQELRNRMLDDLTPRLLEDETVFYRFCKARDFHLEKAEALLRKHIAWRKEYDADSIIDAKQPEVLLKYFPSSKLCFDKEGSIVTYCDLGNTDVKGLLNSTKKGEPLRYILYTNETDAKIMKEQSQKLGKQLFRGIYIYNHENLSLAKVTDRRALEIAKDFATIFQDNYPERVKYVFHINASVYFTMGFSMIKRVISSPLIKKMRCYGTVGWKEDLLQLIDKEELPAFLGGNRTDPDGDSLCRTFVIHGTKVPEQYYLKKSGKELFKKEGVSKLIILRSSKEEVSVEVITEGSYLELEFEIMSRDIGFALRLQNSSSENPIDVIPMFRTDTYYGPEKTLYKCAKTGIYTMVFDNTFSWIHAKEVYYRIKVRPADEVET